MKLVINDRLKGKKLYKEKWRDIEGYEGLYQVSNMGRVRSLDRYDNRGCKIKGRILKGRKTKNGYLEIGLCKDGKKKTCHVHRLVAFAFVKGYFEGAHIDHIDTCKTKNIWTNLRWCTRKENNNNPLSRKHNSEAQKGKTLSEEHKKKLSEARKGENHYNFGKHLSEETKKKMSKAHSKKIICIETGQVFDSMIEAGEYVGVSGSAISRCCKGKRKTCGKHPITGERLHWEYYEEVV